MKLKFLFLLVVTTILQLSSRAETIEHGLWHINCLPGQIAVSYETINFEIMPIEFAIEPPLPPRRKDSFTWNATTGTLCWSYLRGTIPIKETIYFSTLNSTPRINREATVHTDKLRNWKEAAFLWKFRNRGEFLIPASDKGNGKYFDLENAGSLAELKNGTRIIGKSEGFAPLLLEQNGITLLFMNRGDADVPGIRLEKYSGVTLVKQTLRTAGWLEPDRPQIVGGVSCDLMEAPLEIALKNAPKRYFREHGIRPIGREEYLEDAILYCFHPGGTVKGNTRDLGGFNAARQELVPIIKRLGFNLVWLLPLETKSIYRPHDYRTFQANLGSKKEYRDMLDALRGAGIRVWRDIVPHGNSPSSGMFRGNSPFMLLFNEKGEVNPYWCFDFGNPEWQKYMAQIAREYVLEGRLDGLRIDAIKGSRTPNYRRAGFPKVSPTPAGLNATYWRDAITAAGGVPPLEYARGGLTLRRGGLEMAAAIRKAAREINPTAVTLAEANEASFALVSDVIFDSYFANYTVLQLRYREPEQFARGAMRRMHEQNCLDPEGIIRLRYIENHDTTAMSGYFGVDILNALRTLQFVIPGIPLIYQENEILSGVLLAKLIEIRRTLIELRRGSADYSPLIDVPKAIFSTVRKYKGEHAVALINFSNTTQRFPSPLAGYELFTGRILTAGETIELAPFRSALVSNNPQAVSIAPLYPMSTNTIQESPVTTIQQLKSAKTLTYMNSVYRIDFDAITGVPKSIAPIGGKPMALRLSNASGVCEPGQNSLLVKRQDSNILWRFLHDRVTIETQGKELRLSIDNVDRFQINAMEGFVDDFFFTRHLYGKVNVLPGSDYRLRGTPIIWTHETVPLSPAAPIIRAGSGYQQLEINVANPVLIVPEQLEIHDRPGFTLLLKSSHPMLELRPIARKLEHRPFKHTPYRTKKNLLLSCDGLDYIIENERGNFKSF